MREIRNKKRNFQKNVNPALSIEHTWTESALTISPLRRLASSNASRLLPDPVGPEITMTFSLLSFLCASETDDAVAEKRRRRRRQANEGWAAWSRGFSEKERTREKHVRTLQNPPWIISWWKWRVMRVETRDRGRRDYASSHSFFQVSNLFLLRYATVIHKWENLLFGPCILNETMI